MQLFLYIYITEVKGILKIICYFRIEYFIIDDTEEIDIILFRIIFLNIFTKAVVSEIKQSCHGNLI